MKARLAAGAVIAAVLCVRSGYPSVALARADGWDRVRSTERTAYLVEWNSLPGVHCMRVAPLANAIDAWPSWSDPGVQRWERMGYYSGPSFPRTTHLLGMPGDVYVEWDIKLSGVFVTWERDADGFARMYVEPGTRTDCGTWRVNLPRL